MSMHGTSMITRLKPLKWSTLLLETQHRRSRKNNSVSIIAPHSSDLPKEILTPYTRPTRTSSNNTAEHTLRKVSMKDSESPAPQYKLLNQLTEFLKTINERKDGIRDMMWFTKLRLEGRSSGGLHRQNGAHILLRVPQPSEDKLQTLVEAQSTAILFDWRTSH